MIHGGRDGKILIEKSRDNIINTIGQGNRLNLC